MREAGWVAPEDPEADADDAELVGRDLVADRIGDEVAWLRRCVAWLEQLDTGDYPPVVNLRPEGDWPDRAHVAVTAALVRTVLNRIASDLDELGRAGASKTCSRQQPSPTSGLSAGAGWLWSTWVYGSSANSGDCRCRLSSSWNAPGTGG